MYSMFGLNGDYKYNAPAKEVFALVDRCIDAFKLSCHRCGPDVPSFRAAYNEALELIGDFPKLLEAGLNFHSDLIQCCGIIMNDSELDMQSCKNKATSFVELPYQPLVSLSLPFHSSPSHFLFTNTRLRRSL